MKRVFSVLLILVLITSLSVFAFAAGETTVFSWEDVEENLAQSGLEGRFLFLEKIAMKMWLPNTYILEELTEEDADEGYLAYYITEDGSSEVGILYYDVNGTELDELLVSLRKDGYKDAELIQLNGNSAVCYTNGEEDSVNVVFSTERGYFLQVVIYPISDRESFNIASLIIYSIQPVTFMEMNWEDVESMIADAGIMGDFVTFDEIAVKMWMPDVLLPVSLTEEARDKGYIAYYTTEGEDVAVAVMYVDVDGSDLNSYIGYLKSEGIDDAEIGIVNGIEAVGYTNPENDTASMAFATEQGYILEITVSPFSDETLGAVGSAILASVQEA